MSENLKDILSNNNKDIDNQKLMDYLSRQLSKEDSHNLEKTMADDAFMDDAVEGLGYFTNKKDIPDITTQLNQQLQKHLHHRKHRQQKRRWKDNPMTYIIIVVLLALILICYIFIRKQLKTSAQPAKALTQWHMNSHQSTFARR